MASDHITIEQVLWLAAHVSGGKGKLQIAAAVCWAESHGRISAFNVNPGPPRSVDRGLWQINDFYHAEVSDDCAYRAQCNARNAYRISNGWENFEPWSTFTSGIYLENMPPASALPVPIVEPQLSQRFSPSNAPSSGLGPPGAPPFGHPGIVGPSPSSNPDWSHKVRTTGQRAGYHGTRINDVVNTIHRIGVGRSRY